MKSLFALFALMLAGSVLAQNWPKGNVREFWLTTQSPSTGAATNADSGTVVFNVYDDSASTTAFSTGTCVQGATGTYFGTFSTSSMNVGSIYTVIASATISSVNGKSVVDRFRCVGTESITGDPLVVSNGGTVASAASITTSVNGAFNVTSGTLSLGTFGATNLLGVGTSTAGWVTASFNLNNASNLTIGTVSNVGSGNFNRGR